MSRSDNRARRRPRFPCSATEILVVATTISIAIGCGRPFMSAELELMSFASSQPPIDTGVEICLTPELLARTWNVEEHPFRVGLGERTALNFERMVKAAFRETITTFDGECGRTGSMPWITARIDRANRELDSDVYRDQITVVTLSVELVDTNGVPIWRTTTVGETIADPAWFFNRHTAAARDMGESIGKALDRAYIDMMKSKEIRRAFPGPGPVPGIDTPQTATESQRMTPPPSTTTP